MNMQIDFKRHNKTQFLSPEQIQEFGAKVDAIRREVMDDLGEKDAEYIYKIRNFVRYSEIASRGMLMVAGRNPDSIPADHVWCTWRYCQLRSDWGIYRSSDSGCTTGNLA